MLADVSRRVAPVSAADWLDGHARAPCPRPARRWRQDANCAFSKDARGRVSSTRVSRGFLAKPSVCDPLMSRTVMKPTFQSHVSEVADC